MHIHYLRDIPLILGAIVILVGIFRKTPNNQPICTGTDPQWMCRVVFYFVGFVLLGFGVLGNYTPH
jgi:hypothetical protein